MLAFVLVVPRADAELASDRMFALGAAAVEERPSDVDDHVELWTELGDAADAIAAAASAMEATWSWRTVTVDESVAHSWRNYASAIPVTDDVVIVPTWLADATGTGAATPILIDPGASFGMGDHPTTQLTLRALLAELAVRPRPTSVLDVGCGSGVLAIAAALSNARPVVAIDISAAAIEATNANAATNGVESAIAASTTPLADVGGQFDIVVANVLAPALIDMAPDLRRVVAASGVLVVSGVLAERYDHVVRSLSPLVPVATLTSAGWAAVTLAEAVT